MEPQQQDILIIPSTIIREQNVVICLLAVLHDLSNL